MPAQPRTGTLKDSNDKRGAEACNVPVDALGRRCARGGLANQRKRSKRAKSGRATANDFGCPLAMTYIAAELVATQHAQIS